MQPGCSAARRMSPLIAKTLNANYSHLHLIVKKIFESLA
jgi:hypothetical protein